jgi:hypothetical protein
MSGASLKNQVDFPVLLGYQNARRVIARQAKNNDAADSPIPPIDRVDRHMVVVVPS